MAQIAPMALDRDREAGRQIFIEGWFSEQFAAGKRPEYGYPKNHVPDTSIESMEITTGFMATRRQK